MLKRVDDCTFLLKTFVKIVQTILPFRVNKHKNRKKYLNELKLTLQHALVGTVGDGENVRGNLIPPPSDNVTKHFSSFIKLRENKLERLSLATLFGQV
jgi:hypothetical protein